ncbi:unnamed protein product, partial [Iphiclides podalirius]
MTLPSSQHLGSSFSTHGFDRRLAPERRYGPRPVEAKRSRGRAPLRCSNQIKAIPLLLPTRCNRPGGN